MRKITKHLAKETLETIRELILQGQIQQTEEIVESKLQESKNDCEMLLMKGICRLEVGDLSAAADWFKKAIQAKPDFQLAYCNLGLVQLRKGEPALKSLEKAVELDPSDPDSGLLLAIELRRCGKLEEACERIEGLIRNDPTFIKAFNVVEQWALDLNRLELAEDLYRKLIEENSALIPVRRRLVQFYMLTENLNLASQEMKQLALFTSDVNDWMQAGNLAVLAQDLEAGIQCFEQATQLAPSAWEPYCNLADLYCVSGQVKEAGEKYEQAASFGDKRFETHNALGLWLLKMDRSEDAYDHFVKACELKPRSAMLIYNRALAAVRVGKKEEARTLCKQILKTRIENPVTVNAKRMLDALEAVN